MTTVRDLGATQPPLPDEPTPEMISAATGILTGFEGEYGEYNVYCSEESAEEIWKAMVAAFRAQVNRASALIGE